MTSIIFFISSALGCALVEAGALMAAGLEAAAGLAAVTGFGFALLKELGLAGEDAAGASAFDGAGCAKEIETAAKNAVSAKDNRLFIRRSFLTATFTVKLLTGTGGEGWSPRPHPRLVLQRRGQRSDDHGDQAIRKYSKEEHDQAEDGE